MTKPLAPLKLHKNGTITFWSVYDQTWRHETTLIEGREFAAMPEWEREKVQQHIDKYGVVERLA